MNATPRPWKVEVSRHGHFAGVYQVWDKHDNAPADNHDAGNAELIQRAVNTHERAKGVLLQALSNEGQDACCLPVIKVCHCWRCEAKALLAEMEG